MAVHPAGVRCQKRRSALYWPRPAVYRNELDAKFDACRENSKGRVPGERPARSLGGGAPGFCDGFQVAVPSLASVM